MPAHADTTLPQPATAKSWGDSCAARIDAVAVTPGTHARSERYPLVREDGKPNPVVYVSYSTMVGPSSVTIEVGQDTESHPDKTWRAERDGASELVTWFRRWHGRFAKLKTDRKEWAQRWKSVADECLQMGDPK